MFTRELITLLNHELKAEVPRWVVHNMVRYGELNPMRDKNGNYIFTQTDFERAKESLLSPPIEKFRYQ